MLFPYTFLFENINILHSCDNIDVTFYIEMSFILQKSLILIPEMKKTKNDKKREYIRYSADGIYFEGLENIVKLLKQKVQI